MSVFGDWKTSLPAGQGYSAEEAFNAGMTRAAEVCKSLTVNRPSDHAANYHDGGCRHCAEEILKARDGE